MRLPVSGWVENRLSIRSPDSGLMMNMCAVCGLCSAVLFTVMAWPPAILASAEASHIGLPQISAPSLSASYSREREIAICTMEAASGARIIMAMVPMMPKPLRLSLLLPEKAAKLASMETAPASVAVMVMVSVSRLRIWASSWATTPATSSRVSMLRRPVFTATAAFSGLRPVAKALGWSSWMMNSRGMGMPARWVISQVICQRSGALCWSTSCAPYMLSTARSEPQ